MGRLLQAAILLCCWSWIYTTESSCVFDLECPECIPDNMPLVTSHRAHNGSVLVAEGDEVTLSCGASRFVLFPLRATVTARCSAGLLRVAGEATLRHVLDLACQQDMFGDALHSVEGCAPPLQGHSYQLQESSAGPRHLALVCFDEDRGLPVFTQAVSSASHELRLAPHSDRSSPLTLFGNLNGMFDANTRAVAEKLYSDDERLNRRLHELFKHERISFASQRLTSGRLLAPHYFDDQNMRVAEFTTNKVALWTSVAEGNWRHLQRDVARLLRARGGLVVASGTHGEGALRAADGRRPVRLRGERFPTPRYVWSLVAGGGRALVVLVLNEPFVSVSEVREAVFCESACARVSWLRELRRARRFETPLYGLAVCCEAHEAAEKVPEIPRHLLADVPRGAGGVLTELPA
ncbi:uncharacterized protein LOC116772316 [Danaus plexippus]|uniref:uncharacterized protein LOC116772316 n=1 Tax=Danaus plexippus TaxID=13037 RepID=UPI002AB00982|nr:uncharacterized protein LOC116772316 [Danaus plexippus]